MLVENEEVLEELYELLGLYFSLKIPGGIIEKNNLNGQRAEPSLDRIELQEKIFAEITSTIIEKLI